MKKKLLIVIVFILLMGIAYDVVHRYEDNKALEKKQTEQSIKNKFIDSTPDEKVEASDFKLKDLNGKEVSLSKLKGKKIFINFWATWCPPCKAEMPDIEKLYKENKDNKDVVILVINMGENKDTVEKFIKENNYSFTVLLDESGNTSDAYNISAIPTSFFIDKDGKINSKTKGTLTLEEMRLQLGKIK